MLHVYKMAAAILLLAALSLYPRPTKLRSLKQAFRQGHDKNMSRRPTRSEVIEIPDDDEDELPYPQRPPARTAFSSQSRTGRVDGDDEAELENSSSDSDSSGAVSPLSTNRHVILHHRPRSDDGSRHRSSVSRTSSEASSHMMDPRSMKPAFRAQNHASSVSLDEDAGHTAAPPSARPLEQAQRPAQGATKPIHRHQRAVREADPCPYYYDHELGVKMFQGKGYERFPVVLGTVEGHKEICDEWDARRPSGSMTQQKHSTENETVSSSARSIAELGVEHACLQEVLRIFPEIEHDFVRSLYQKKYSGAVAKDVVMTVSGALIAAIAELETYPRQKNLKRKASPVASDETGITINWNKDLPKNHEYCRETIILLATVFDHIPTHYIAQVVKDKESLFESFGVLSEKENCFYAREPGQRPYKRLRQPRRALEVKYRRKNFEQRDDHQYTSLVNELQAARQNQEREACRIKRQKASDDLESENLALHIAQGSMVECQCCFDEKPINRAVPCEGEEAHFFCNDCVRRQAESQVGAMKYEMLCMDTSGCKAGLSTDAVAQAIPLQLFDKLAFNQQQAEISSAGIEGLEMCPFCDFKAICEPVEVDSVFDCQNPDCGLVTCRKCKEPSHLPKTCEEVKTDKGLGARHQVEEARSLAMMRTCPRCKVKLIKEYGCNKMCCTNCHALMCYVCQKDISGTGKEQGYDHFHRAGATCALHDQTGVDRHKAEADAAEIAAIAKAKAEHGDVDEKQLRIETGKNNKDLKTTNLSYVPLAQQVRADPHRAYYDEFQIPIFAAGPAEVHPNPFLEQAQQGIRPNFPQFLPPGQELLPGQMQQDLDQMQQLIGPPVYEPPNGQVGPVPLRGPGLQEHQAMQAFLQRRRRNPA